MVVKIYISGISGNKEVKKRQQRVLMILDSKNVEYEIIDITEPGKELEKEFMQTTGLARESKYPLPPQIFNEEVYCGDYEDFDLANEMDELEDFLKIEPTTGGAQNAPDSSANKSIQQNGNTTSREPSTDKDAAPPATESVEERTSVPHDTAQAEEPKPAEEASETKNLNEEETEHMEDNTDKNEEKSDDQEKEE